MLTNYTQTHSTTYGHLPICRRDSVHPITMSKTWLSLEHCLLFRHHCRALHRNGRPSHFLAAYVLRPTMPHWMDETVVLILGFLLDMLDGDSVASRHNAWVPKRCVI